MSGVLASTSTRRAAIARVVASRWVDVGVARAGDALVAALLRFTSAADPTGVVPSSRAWSRAARRTSSSATAIPAARRPRR